MTHQFTQDPSAVDAEVCTCGKGEFTIHHPHEFQRDPRAQPAGSATRCRCGKPLADKILHGSPLVGA